LSGRDVQIVYTGLREGEKLHEELVGDGETDDRPVHPKISHASVPPLHPALLATAVGDDAWSLADSLLDTPTPTIGRPLLKSL